MRLVASSNVNADLIRTPQELAQIAILGAFLHRDILITASQEDEVAGTRVAIRSRDEELLDSEIARLVAISSTVRDQSVDEVLTEVRRQLQRWGYPMEGKPSDNRPFGAGIE